MLYYVILYYTIPSTRQLADEDGSGQTAPDPPALERDVSHVGTYIYIYIYMYIYIYIHIIHMLFCYADV